MVRKIVHHGDPRPDILSPWRQLLNLPIPCHVHWQRSYCRSRSRKTVICRKPCFRGQPCVHVRACVLGPCLHAGCARAAWVGGRSRGNAMGARGRCMTPRVGCVRWSGPARNGLRLRGLCASGHVAGWASQCLPAVQGRTCVDAWTGVASGGSFRGVVPGTV